MYEFQRIICLLEATITCEGKVQLSKVVLDGTMRNLARASALLPSFLEIVRAR